MNIYKNLPPPEKLMSGGKLSAVAPLRVNGHFHTPYSFSAFTALEQVLEMALDEHVDVLGINDFYTMAGYGEFAELCMKYRKFPLFNIEFMGLLKEQQEKGIRVNDPNNPGRTYFSGKGLDYPVSLKGRALEILQGVRAESDRQTREMVEKASAHLSIIDPDLSLDYDHILENHTRGMVRERHIARVIRMKVFDKYTDETDRRSILSRIYGTSESHAPLDNHAALEGEIRSRMLKAGGVAFVPEDPKAFLEIGQVIGIILEAGGIPCYPVLLDDKSGNYTEFEADPEELYRNLTSMNVFSLELIPGRNNIENLRKFVKFFDERGFLITFGTEHNTPALEPLTVSADGPTPLDDYLLDVSYRGACVTAAHQYLRSLGRQGYVNAEGSVVGERDEFYRLGHSAIRQFIHQ